MLHLKTLLYSLFLLTTATVNNALSCGYENCPKYNDSVINVHLIAHTHDDVGWIKTFEQYYYGQKMHITRSGVQYILDNVIKDLLSDHERRFIYVETAFFWKWWQVQPEKMKENVRHLVDQGRLEFIGGGWSMNDEGCAHYLAIIDQMTLGNRKLLEKFGKCGLPKVAWQIDPFGHSKEQALLFAKMGFDGLFIGRLDYMDKALRQKEKRMEFVWEASDEDKIRGHLFTGVLPNGYGPPKGFCFDDLCFDEPIIDNPSSEEYNLDEKLNAFLAAVNEQRKYYATNHLIMTMGEDFNYQNSRMWFKNLDKLIKQVNKRQDNIKVFYSTPSCYLYALNKQNLTWTVKDDDIFPYASDPHAYWGGYFTSRPALKRFIRESNNFLQAVKQLQLISKLHDNRTSARVIALQEALAVNQHHDAVTGTEQQHVANDYAKMLDKAKTAAQKIVSDAFENFVGVHQKFCNKLNISECDITESNSSLRVSIYNPCSSAVNYTVRLPWTGKTFNVLGPNKEAIKANLAPIPQSVKNIPGRMSEADNELIFQISLSPLGYTTCFVSVPAAKVNTAAPPTVRRSKHRKSSNVLHYDELHSSFKLKNFEVLFDEKVGLINGIKLNDGKQFKFNQTFRWYYSMAGANSHVDDRASGAYVFRPNGSSNELTPLETKVYNYGHLTEIHQVFNKWISQTIRLDANEDFIEYDWIIGPIPVDDMVGKELVSVYSTDLNTEKTFYTDSNGRQILKRVRDYRPSWTLNVTEPIAGNYYPVNSRIILKDEKQNLQLTALTDRSEGGSSLSDGVMELMLHRRCLHDDNLGVNEALNETDVDGNGLVIRGKHYLIASTITDGGKLHRLTAQRIFNEPIISFADESIPGKNENSYSELIVPLPTNINLLTLEFLEPRKMLLRLEHFFSGTDDPDNLSKPVKIDLRKIFKSFKVIGSVEMSLNANRPLSSVKRLHWRTTNSNYTLADELTAEPVKDFAVTLQPMQIRTFLVFFA